MTDETVSLLRELIHEVRELRSDMRGKLPSPLTRPQHQKLQYLLPAVFLLFDNQVFTAADLVTSESLGLRAILGHTSAKSLGHLLTKAAGAAVGSYVINLVTIKGKTSHYAVVKTF